MEKNLSPKGPALPDAPSNLPANKKKEIYDLLMENKAQLELALPKHLTADRLIRVFVTAMSSNPKLLTCTKTSLLACVLEASQLGLEFDGILGHAYLVPFRNNKTGCTEATFIPGYKGLIELARRSNEIMNLTPGVVYEGDTFNFQYGMNQDLRHIPGAKCSFKKEDITHFYTYAHLKNGGFEFKVMTKGEVETIRKMSKAPNSEAWVEHYEWMGKKTCIKQLCKILPTSTEYRRAHTLDDLAEAGKQRLDFGNFNPELGRVDISLEGPVAEALPEPKSKSEATVEAEAPAPEEKQEAGASPEAGAPAQGSIDLGNNGKSKKEFFELVETMKTHDKKNWPRVEKIIDAYCNKVSRDSKDLLESHYTELLAEIRKTV